MIFAPGIGGALLQLDEVRKTYRTGSFTQAALAGVTITFRDNEFVAVLGPSGSGKTTLLNIVGGLDHADSGDLVIDGVSTRQYKDRDWDTYRNNRIGFVFQSYNLIPHQSVLANVELALTLSGVNAVERRKRAIEALTEVGLNDHINKLPGQLSGGQMQRVAIARALVNDPEIVLADEPTGALDSTTGTQVMDLLAEIAQDRLVVMVTHNPDLADQYATRIVSLKDGLVVDDTDPYDPDETAEDARAAAPVRRTSMSFLTAIGLSFTNLMTKKGRTLMTSFAGSIGIVGIATILALANGVNVYIRGVEENTLSLYPLTIATQGIDLASIMTGAGGGNSTDPTSSPTGQAHEVDQLARMFSHIGTNDLSSLKQFLDSPQSGISQYATSVEYSYNVTPQIFAPSTDGTVRQVNPNTVFSALGVGGAGATQMSSSFSLGMTADSFSALPANTDLVKSQYDVVAGHWPTNYNQVLLVLTSSGGVPDGMLYTMGLRDPTELQNMVDALANGTPITVPTDTNQTYTYQQLMAPSFTLVPATAFYQFDPTYDVWTDRSTDQTWMQNAVANGEPLSIVGVVQPDPSASATMLGPGLYYPASLITHLMDEAAKSAPVLQQLAYPDINVFSGHTFAEDNQNSGLANFDFSSMINVNPSAMSSLFNFDPSKLNLDTSGLDMSSMSLNAANLSIPPPDLTAMLGGLNIQASPQAVSDLMNQTLTDYIDQALGGNNPLAPPTPPASPTPSDSATPTATPTDTPTDTSTDSTTPTGTPADTPTDTTADSTTATDTPTPTDSAAPTLPTSLPSDIASILPSGLPTTLPTTLPTSIPTTLPSIPNATDLVNSFSSWFAQPDVQATFMARLGQTIDLTSVQQQLTDALTSYLQQAMQQVLTSMMSALQTQLSLAMKATMAQMASQLSTAMAIDPSKLSNLFSFNMDANQLTTMLMSMMNNQKNSEASNLTQLGYADPSNPSSIDIYPKDFASKQQVLNILDSYNTRMTNSDQPDKVITYTDIVNKISAVLVAFVSISLVVSSIMIGVITYISVLERRKEIGILRAMGASKRNIANVFNAETLIVGFIAGVMGVLITVGLTLIANPIISHLYNIDRIARLPLTAALALIAISMVLTLVAGLIPSSAASKRDPVEALRSE